jgi:hypothetical protein
VRVLQCSRVGLCRRRDGSLTCAGLSSVNLSGTGADDDTVLAMAAGCPLRHVSIEGCDAVSADAGSVLVRASGYALVTLALSATAAACHAVATEVAQHCGRLKDLRLSRWPSAGVDVRTGLGPRARSVPVAHPHARNRYAAWRNSCRAWVRYPGRKRPSNPGAAPRCVPSIDACAHAHVHPRCFTATATRFPPSQPANDCACVAPMHFVVV